MAVNVGTLRAVMELRDQFSGPLRNARKGLDETSVRAGAFGGSIKSLVPVIGAAAGAVAAFAGTRALGRLAGSFVRAADTAEGYRVRLETLLGSQEEGNKLFREASALASRLPFEFEEIMGAATSLSGVVGGGAENVASFIPMIADLATVSGLTFQQTSEQVQRMFSAGAGAADLFRERGVLAMMGFKAGVKTSVDDTRRILIEAWADPESKFRGASERMASTWTGLTSMMKDSWFQFRTAVMDQGLADALKSVLQKAVDLGPVFAKSGEIIGKTIGLVIESLGELGNAIDTVFSFGGASGGLVSQISIRFAQKVNEFSIFVQGILNLAADLVEALFDAASQVPFIGILFGIERVRSGNAVIGFLRERANAVRVWAQDTMQSLAEIALMGHTTSDGFTSSIDEMVERLKVLSTQGTETAAAVAEAFESIPIIDVGGGRRHSPLLTGADALFTAGAAGRVNAIMEEFRAKFLGFLTTSEGAQVDSIGKVKGAWIQAGGAVAGAILNFLRGSGDLGSALGGIGGAFGGVVGKAMGLASGSPWGAVVTTGLSLAGGILGDIFGGSKPPPAWLKIMQATGTRLGEEFAQSIINAAEKTFKGQMDVAFRSMLADVIRELGGLEGTGELRRFGDHFAGILWDIQRGAMTATQGIEALTDAFGPMLDEVRRIGDPQTFRQLTATIRRTLDEVATGVVSVAQANELLDATFDDLTEAAREFGAEGIRSIRALINESRQLGQNFGAIQDFISRGVKSMMTAAQKVLDSVRTVSIFGDVGGERVVIREAIPQAMVRNLRLAAQGIALAFREAMASGMDLSEVIETMRDQVRALKDRFIQAGEEIPQHLRQMGRFLRRLADEDVQALLMQLDGIGGIIQASIDLALPPTKAAMATFRQTIQETFRLLQGEGLTARQAAQAMLPQLIQAAQLARDFGMVLGEDIQEMLKLAGIDVTLLPESEINILKQGFDAIVQGIKELTQVILDFSVASATLAPTRQTNNRPQLSFAGGSGGFMDFGSGSSAVLHGREQVVTQREGASLAAQVGSAIEAAMRRGGSASDEFRSFMMTLPNEIANAVGHKVATTLRRS